MNRKQQIAVVVGVLISALFLWFAFRDLDPETVLDEIQKAEIGWLILGGVWYFTAVAVITLRWQFLLRAIKFVSLRRLYPLVCIGYMGNNVYPFRSGEALRIFLLQRNTGVPIIRATTTVIVERVFDGLVMLTFILVPLQFIDVASDDVRQVATFATPIFLFALGVFFVLATKPDVLRRLVGYFIGFMPKKIGELVTKINEEVIHGLESLRSPKYLAGAIVSSYLTWALEASVYWAVSFAFDLDTSYAVMLVVVGTVNLAGLLPASPGQIGVFEFFVSAVLIGVGIDEVLAASYALTVHVVIWLPVTLAGFGFLIQQGLSWKSITRAHEIEEQAIESSAS